MPFIIKFLPWIGGFILCLRQNRQKKPLHQPVKVHHEFLSADISVIKSSPLELIQAAFFCKALFPIWVGNQ